MGDSHRYLAEFAACDSARTSRWRLTRPFLNVIDRQLYAHHISLAILAMDLTTRLASDDLLAAFSLEWRLHGMGFQSTDGGCRAVAYSALTFGAWIPFDKFDYTGNLTRMPLGVNRTMTLPSGSVS